MTIRILIVDDDTGFLDVAAELIAERGFEVLEKATDAAQALATAAEECPGRAICWTSTCPGEMASRQRRARGGLPVSQDRAYFPDAGHVAAEVLRGCRADAFVAKQELATTDLADLFGRGEPGNG